MNLLINNKEILFNSICDEHTNSLNEKVVDNFRVLINEFEKTIKEKTDIKRFLNYKLSLAENSLLIVEWFFRDVAFGFIIEEDYYKSSWYVKGNVMQEQNGHISTLKMENLLILLKASGVF